MKRENSKKIKSLRRWHMIIIILSVFGIAAVLFMDNWITWLPIMAAICFDGKFEKSDELAKQIVSRANIITLWTLFAVLGVFAMYARFHTLTVVHILVAMLSALAIRSLLFIIFDCSFMGKEKSDG